MNKKKISITKIQKILDKISFKKKIKKNIAENLDSMQIFHLISEIESQFKIKIKDTYINEKKILEI